MPEAARLLLAWVLKLRLLMIARLYVEYYKMIVKIVRCRPSKMRMYIGIQCGENDVDPRELRASIFAQPP